ncbi:hypothetical protein KY290_005056 [Solanum tuberosum]|uniref:MULE transposase domain-containing protein n=1 Tax=Solanum tuberosum TaxID=4113 RepID=A0ABQ7WD34_SOLTU|nr:hypothetical protein KY290_005056 [Solanum tuberosum]
MDVTLKNSEHCESSTKVASGIFGSLCIIDFEEFEKQKLTVAEIVNPLDTFQMENCSVVITDPSHKYVKVDQVYNNKAILKCVMEQYAIAERFQFKTKRSNSIRLDLGVDITYMLAWRAKQRALISLRGMPRGSYNKLPEYLYILGITYPGSHIRLQKTDEDRFLYLFVALDPFTKGFDHCRPVVVVSGSHLRGPYNGTFVAASTTDGACHIFPLAYNVLDSENDASWTCFFEQLRESYGERNNMCIVSDRNKNIIKEILKINEAMSTRLMIFSSTEYVHNVNDKGRNYIVCLQKKRRTCGSFQYEEISCEHAWAVLKFKSLGPDEFCSNLYTPTTVLKTCDFSIYPLPNKTEWVVPRYIMTDLVLPPEFKRLP